MIWLLGLTTLVTRQSVFDSDPLVHDQYVRGIQALKASGEYDAFTRSHADASLFYRVHGTAFFLPWHRHFVSVFENSLQTTLQDPSFALPYWDWTYNPKPPSFLGSLLGDNTSHCISDPEWLSAWKPVAGGDCIKRIDNKSHPIPTHQDIEDVYDKTNFSSFSHALENGPHLSIHSRVGGNMGGMASPDDPLFWLHHAFVDKVWCARQQWEGTENQTLRALPLPGTDLVVEDVWDATLLGYTYDYL